MENYIKNNLKGEILIPLETYYKHQEINKIEPKQLFQYTYKSFRSIVFPNEYLHFFLVILFEPNEEENNFNIHELNDYFKNNCFINIQYAKKFEEKKEKENLEIINLKEEIYYTLEETEDRNKFINNGILKNCEIIEDKNIIIYELYSRIKIKDSDKANIPNNSKIDINISITKNKRNNLYDDLDINDIHIINYINLDNDTKTENDDGKVSKKYSLFNISKTLTIINPLKIDSMNQYDFGNNKYLLTIKIENITYKINFIDQTLKNSLILKKEQFEKENRDDVLYFEFPIILTNIYIDNEKAFISDILFLNFLKLEQERNLEGGFNLDKNGIKYNILNAKFPVVLNPKEIYSIVFSVEKKYFNYLLIDEETKNNSKENSNMINQLIKLIISTPIYINISTNKPIHNLIWNFSLKWKDEINNKLSISFNIEKKEIKIYNFFKVFFKINKTHKEKIKFEFKFNDSYEDFTLNKDSNTSKGDNLPDIFPEKKSFIAELDEEEFEKIIEFRYMPIRKEYIELPPFEILDVNLDKIYLIFFTNKIYVNE